MSLPSLGWRKLFDHLIRPQQQRLRDRQPERLGGLEVDDQLELGGLLDGKIGGPPPQEIRRLIHRVASEPIPSAETDEGPRGRRLVWSFQSACRAGLRIARISTPKALTPAP